MDEKRKQRTEAVIKAAKELNLALNRAADVGILVDVSVTSDDPGLTIGTIPCHKVVVKVYAKE